MWSRFVAIGDSFTEGMSDRYPNSTIYRGWADRLTEQMARKNPDLLYANLAIRGRLTSDVVEQQVPRAIELEPDLVSMACGVNDLMRRSFDFDQWRDTYESGIRALREAGTDVLVTAFGNPEGRPGVPRSWVERYRLLNEATVEIAHSYDCYLLNFWPMKQFDRDIYWSADRLHLSTLGHQVTAELAAHVLGIPFDYDSTKIDIDRAQTRVQRRLDDLAWLSVYAVPWALRRVVGRSSGDGITEKRPTLMPVRR